MKIRINSEIFPLEVVLHTCYNFLDQTYILLDNGKREKEIVVTLKSKRKIPERLLKVLRSEFMNDLIYSALRLIISKNNKKIREFVFGRALYSSLNPPETTLFKDDNFKDDPLGIAIPWEEKYGKKHKHVRAKV